jgi:Rrf2 family protein
MKITAQEEYGLRCLLRFARIGPEKSLTIPDIAAAENLSVPYAAKLLSVLRQGGLIESARGRNGGYRLAAAPADIGLSAVLLVLGEPLFDDPGFCQRHAGTETGGACVHHTGCTLRALWRGLEQWMRGALGRITLADLLENEVRIPELLRSRLTDVIAESPALIRLSPLIPLGERVGSGGARAEAQTAKRS